MIRYLLVISIVTQLLFPAGASSQDIEIPLKLFQSSTICSENITNSLELTLENKIIFIKLDSIYSTPIISSSIVCKRLLDSISGLDMPEVRIKLKRVSPPDSTPIFKEISGFLDSFCLYKGYCKKNILDIHRVRDSLRQCQMKPSIKSLLKSSLPKIRRNSPEIISKMAISVHPFRPLSDIFSDYYYNPEIKELHASTMTFSDTFLKTLRESSATNKNVFISYDASHSLIRNQEKLLIELSKNNLGINLLPMTSGENFTSFYHYKFIASPESSNVVVASMNFSNPINSNFIDFNFHFDDSEIRNELLSLSKLNQASYCDNPQNYECLSDFYRGIAPPEDISIFQKSCKSNSTEFKSNKRHFLNTKDDDLQDYMVRFINSAKNELLIISYKFSNREMFKALLNAQLRGVRVYVYLAQESHLIREKFDHYNSAGEFSLKRTPYPHMKLIVADKNKMLFGTPNFTQNALNNSLELIGVTDNPLAIQTAYDYAAVFSQFNGLKISRYLSSTEKNIHLISSKKNNGQTVRSIPLTRRIKQQSLKAYRKPLRRGERAIKICGLKHLFLISAENYMRCLKRLGDN